MHSWGHVGAALFCYGPVGAALTRYASPTLALVGVVVAVALSTLPDADELVPVDHRGPTHTVWFVAVGALLAAGAAAGVGLVVGRPAALATAVGSAAFVSLGSHLLADSVTPMGVRPLYPLSTWHHSFDVTPAANPRANATMLGVGALSALGWQAAALL